jgi:dTDP-4-amino-4,6-dideoxygalactose transaminase
MKVPYVDLVGQNKPIKSELMKAMESVLDHGQFILGEEVTEFERRFADLCQVPYAVGVNSGTDALIMSLKALDIGPDDEVITVPNSFVSSTSCIALVGAKPVFIDVGPDYNMDPEQLEAAITPRTKAILPIHLTGRPANMAPILKTAKKYDLAVIEDAAQAVGAEYEGQRVGSLGTVGCFSLHPLKTLNACGDGGVMTTNDAKLYETFKTLRNIGLATREDCVVWSGNSRLDTLQAAILLVKMDHFEEWTEQRRKNAQTYRDLLRDIPQIKTPQEFSYERPVYHTFVIQAERRNDLKNHLAKSEIGCAIHYPIPIHTQTAGKYLGYEPGSFPVSEGQADHILSLPIYPELKKQQLEFVTERIRDFYMTTR